MTKSSQNRGFRSLAAALTVAVALTIALPALADDYDDRHSGHPLRIVAYVVHPIGVILDYLIFRPFHWVGSHEPFSTLFGHEEA
ncbi:MAG: hypothetical protein IIA30_11115 [Myxococcales bacterium]|nr:hypothetical protein [Myxococcales bacterium]